VGKFLNKKSHSERWIHQRRGSLEGIFQQHLTPRLCLNLFDMVSHAGTGGNSVIGEAACRSETRCQVDQARCSEKNWRALPSHTAFFQTGPDGHDSSGISPRC